MRPATSTALLGLALILLAGLFDAEPLYVPGVGFILLAGGAAAWVWFAARGVCVTRTVSARRTLEDQPVAIEIEVSSGRVPLPSGFIDDELLPAPAPMAAGRRHPKLRITARFGRRGRKELAPPRIIVRDPFGLATRVVAADEAAELLVLPRIEPVVAPPGDGDGSGLAARRGRPAVAAEVDLDGLRPYRVGAAASRIFWPALARGGELMERRLRADGDTRPLIVLDPRSPLRAEDLDAAVRAAGSLCVYLAREGGCALLLPGDRRPTALESTLAGWPHLHVRLALVDRRTGPNIVGLASRRGPVLYVCAHARARAPRPLAHAVAGGRILVVPGISGDVDRTRRSGRRAIFTVAGCIGYELGGSRHSVAEVA